MVGISCGFTAMITTLKSPDTSSGLPTTVAPGTSGFIGSTTVKLEPGTFTQPVIKACPIFPQPNISAEIVAVPPAERSIVIRFSFVMRVRYN